MPSADPNFENRLDRLRGEAHANGRVAGRGVNVTGGPIPSATATADAPSSSRPTRGASENGAGRPGYYGMPVVKPPVWTWEIPLYFFIGGLSGMATVVALAAWCFRQPDLARAAAWTTAVGGGLISPALLIMDLGRPKLFLNMLRVFKHRSPMSMGVYILVGTGAFSVPAALAVELHHGGWFTGGWETALGWVAGLLLAGAAVFGTLLATYTGVLIGATVIPAWFTHRALLPAHFGTAGLGCAVGWLTLWGYRLPVLHALGVATAAVETGFWLWLLLRRHGKADRALHEGRPGAFLQTAEILTGPVALALWLLGWSLPAAVTFLGGALLNRFGWILAGRVSGRDPEAVFASQVSPSRLGSGV